MFGIPHCTGGPLFSPGIFSSPTTSRVKASSGPFVL